MVKNDEIKETGDEMRIKVESGYYKRFTSFAGLRMGKDGWHVSAELGAVLAGNNEQSQFRMSIDGFDNEMDIRGSNRDAAYLGLGGGYEREIHNGITVYGLVNFVRGRDGYEQNIGASLGVKVMLPASQSGREYMRQCQAQKERHVVERARLDEQRKRAAAAERIRLTEQRKINAAEAETARQRKQAADAETARQKRQAADAQRLKAEQEAAALQRARQTAAGQAGTRGELLGSYALDSTISNSSYDDPGHDLKAPMRENDIYVYVLTDNGKNVAWRLFEDLDPKDFNEDGIELPSQTKKKIADNLSQYQRRGENIVRVRILGYGQTDNAAILALSKARSEEIYKEINKQRSAVNAANGNARARAEADVAAVKTAEKTLEANLQEARVRRTSAANVYKLKAASFKSSSDVLSPDARKKIAAMAKDMIAKNYTRITIEGHTDATGRADANVSLSNRRALAVYIELLRNGITQDKMQTMGLGSKIPASSNSTEKGKANNRRVEIFLE